MKRLIKPSKGQLALCLEREVSQEFPPDQEAALLQALADLLLEALGEAPAASNEAGVTHEP